MTTTVILTNYGNDKILQAIADDTTVTVSAIVYGDGNGSEYVPLPTQTNLIHELGSISLLEKTFDALEGFIYFKGVIEASSADLVIRELGLLDDSDRLLAIATIPSTSKPSVSEGLEVSLPISIGFKTSIGSVLIVEHDASEIASKQWTLDNFQLLSEKGQNNGYAPLNDEGIVPAEHSLIKYNNVSSTTYSGSPARTVILKNEADVPILPLTDARNVRTDSKASRWIGTYSQYDAITTKDANTTYYITDNGEIYQGNSLISNISSSRNIGEIVASAVPLKDSGLHLLDGTRFYSGGSFDAFVTYIKSLVTDYPDLFVSEATWQSSVANYGVCGKFVYVQPNTYYQWKNDSVPVVCYTTSQTPRVGDAVYRPGLAEGSFVEVAQVVEVGADYIITSETSSDVRCYWTGEGAVTVDEYIRLPKITGFIEGTTDEAALGDLTQQLVKLPNIAGWIRFNGTDPERASATSDGTFVTTSYWTTGGNDHDAGIGHGGVLYNFDASRVSNVYSGNGTNTKVHPQAIKTLYYIVIANSVKTGITVDIDNIVTDLNGKTDTNLVNVNNTGLSFGASWPMPSGTYEDLVLGASGTAYTAPATGWVQITRVVQSGYLGLTAINADETDGICMQANNPTSSAITENAYIPVSKGQAFKVNYSGISTNAYSRFKFIYANGSESEA